MKTIHNPVIPGFNPDPCIIRVDRDYYLATSTFEWWPAVLIYHSRDLVNWNLVAKPIDRVEQLDLRGTQGSRGVWAPALSYDGELFHIAYTHGKLLNPHYLDQTNYLVTAPSITGPWSDRVTINRTGFDPSIFHDDDGRKYYLNMMLDPDANHTGEHWFAGIVMQEYCPKQKKLIGEDKIIFPGTDLRYTEGPHLYKKDGYYYLVCAEGGSNWNHSVTVARSKEIWGPYEVHPDNPIITSDKDGGNPLQKSGHGSIVDTPESEWYCAHLCSRPDTTKHSVLGRETSIQKLVWPKGDWPRKANGSREPELEVEAPINGEALPDNRTNDIRFSSDEPLYPYFQTLREPVDSSWLSLQERPGWLRLYGRESLYCDYEQSLIGHRVESVHESATTRLDFEPEHFRQSAGIAAFYDDNGWMYLSVAKLRTSGQKILRLTISKNQFPEYPVPPIPLEEGPVDLKIQIDGLVVRFFYRQTGEWHQVGTDYESKILADEFGNRMRFTGAFFVLCAQDATARRTPADFAFLKLDVS